MNPVSPTPTPLTGDADIAQVALLFSEPARARVLMALADGRALPASVLADEAGVSAPTMSAHLARLREAGLVQVEPSGRHRYYRLTDHRVMDALESMARLAPTRPVTSLREGTRAAALRRARTCYDHLAGRLGVDLMAGLVETGALVTVDGDTSTRRRAEDPISAMVPRGREPYRLGPQADPVFARLGVDLAALQEHSRRSRRPVLRCCVDWTEQRHHLAGLLGARLCEALTAAGMVRRLPRQRAVRLTDTGRDTLTDVLGTIRDEPAR